MNTEPAGTDERVETMTEGQRLQQRAVFAILYSLGLLALAWLTYPYSPIAVILVWVLTWHLSSRKRRREQREAAELARRYLESEKQYLDKRQN